VHGPGGAIWIDAHGDLNSPETSPTAMCMGWSWRPRSGWPEIGSAARAGQLPAVAPDRVALIGVRSLDEGERGLLKELDALVYTMSDVDRLGARRRSRGARASPGRASSM
jgi:arginase